MIAEALGLPNPHHYTGHCLRRTSITHAADKGLSLPQIKAISGHKSDTVVQSYISKSDAMRTVAARALSLDSLGTPLINCAKKHLTTPCAFVNNFCCIRRKRPKLTRLFTQIMPCIFLLNGSVLYLSSFVRCWAVSFSGI